MWGWTLHNVTLGWQKHTLFKNINFQYKVDKDYALPIMGASGEGKSTFLYLLASYKYPTNGEIAWYFPNGDNLTWSNENKLSQAHEILLRRKYFGFSFQDSSLFPYMTIEENLTYPLTLLNTPKNEIQSKIHLTLDNFLNEGEKSSIKRILNSFPYEISGGQKQRIALAKALIHDPIVLFADEPTGQLDIRSRQQVMDKLNKWLQAGFNVKTKRFERLLIWVTHHHTSDMHLMNVQNSLFIENSVLSLKDKNAIQQWGELQEEEYHAV